ncbi:uncharacterized protein LOC127623599 [Xyrauchen texanus]|uniref:uncharacterized protein LOC127623599 n=1 Tax=Xyrauchen texanus TaxID=154827 RepID=UPI0022426E55|nr:uncharacterized protein LOC127623599 [Xyrauchen texanus]
MLNGATLQSLLLAAVFLSSWAAPLESTVTSDGTCCGGQQRRMLETDVISTKLPQSSSPDGPGSVEEEAVVNGSAREGVGRATAVGNEDRQSGAGERAVWSYSRYQKLSVDEQQSSTIPASRQSVVDQLLVTTDGVSLLQASTTSSTVEQERDEPVRLISEDVEGSNGSSFAKGKSGNIQPGGLDEKGTATPQTRTPLQKNDRRLEADTITRTPSDPTDGPFRFSPLTTNPTTPQTSLTITSGDSLGGLDLQDNTPVSGLRQLDLTFNSRLVDPSDTWTEPVHLLGEEVSVLPSSQEVAIEATMSSEDLPLIFEPFEDVTMLGDSAPVSEPSVAMAATAVTVGDAELEQMMSMDTGHASDATLSGVMNWPPSWQTSGDQKYDAVSPSNMLVNGPVTESDEPKEHDENTQSDDIMQRSVTQQPLTEAVQLPASKPKTDTEDVESREPDEDEEDEEMNLNDEEEESEEDLTETTTSTPTRAPYSLIPPPPVWVQRNQGLVRSWVELIREKAGYVSGMLAPVGIGIAGALLLVGALYSIRVIHHKRRDNFKHQRRKPPREVRSGPDNAMLLADSSEDEF